MKIKLSKQERNSRKKDLKSGLWNKKAELAIGLLSKYRGYKFVSQKKNEDGKTINDFIKKYKIKKVIFFKNAFIPHWRNIPARKYLIFRESFDEALVQLSLYEIAVSTGYLDLSDLKDEAEKFVDILLSNRNAKKYLIDYDYFLVRYLLSRISNKNKKLKLNPPKIEHDLGNRFAIFLSNFMSLYENENVDLFLGFLDDYNHFDADDEKADLKLFIETGYFDDEGYKYYRMYIEDLKDGYVNFVYNLNDFFDSLNPDEIQYYGLMYAYWLGKFFNYDTNKNNLYYKIEYENKNQKPIIWAELEFPNLKNEIELLRQNWEIIISAINAFNK